MSNQDFYVYFEKSSGEIKKISGRLEECNNDIHFIKVYYEQIKDIYEGKKSFGNYIVRYDIKNKEYSLLLKGQDFKNYDINDHLYKIPMNVKKTDIVVMQNLKKEKWEVKLNRKVTKKIIEDGFKSYSNLLFSVTKKDDPNIIYRSFKISIQDLIDQKSVSILFISKKEITDDLSVFTNKYFDTYTFKVNND